MHTRDDPEGSEASGDEELHGEQETEEHDHGDSPRPSECLPRARRGGVLFEKALHVPVREIGTQEPGFRRLHACGARRVVVTRAAEVKEPMHEKPRGV
jgi:hypothetical protein